MEISSVYKVDGIEFETEEEAKAYVDQLNQQMVQQQELENQREIDLAKIVEAETQLNELYVEFERNYMYLPNRSNNIKELLKIGE